MTSEEIYELIQRARRQLKATPTSFHRHLMGEIAWEDTLICIQGARGTGKTTLMKQRLKEQFGESCSKALYVSLDDLWFSRYRVEDVVVYLYDHGYTHLFMDEVHHHGRDWSQLMKNLCDQFPGMSFVYSGSSMLQMAQARSDLSRRQAVYSLNGLSFREFLKFEGALDYPAVSLEEILERHVEIAEVLTAKTKLLPLFERYCEMGFYPFYRSVHGQYRDRLVETVNKVLYDDYPAMEDVSQETIRRVRKMLMVLSASTPQTPNMSQLYQQLETDRLQGLKMLRALELSGLLALVPGKGANLKNLAKPDKIYCDNTNLMYALVQHPDVGVMRETFFFNQLRKKHEVVFSGVGDFLVDGRYVFEVGGKEKGFEQIRNLPDSFVVSDGIEVGMGNRIPLWLFGFLY